MQLVFQRAQPARHRIKTHRGIWQTQPVQQINPPGQCRDLRGKRLGLQRQRLLAVLQRLAGDGIFIARRCQRGNPRLHLYQPRLQRILLAIA